LLKKKKKKKKKKIKIKKKMCNTPMESYVHLPSPPLSPFRNCDNDLEIEPVVCEIQENDLKDTLISPVENTTNDQEDTLRIQYKNMIEEGIKANEEIIPYQYYIHKLHNIGSKIINKRTKDAIPLRVYETEKEEYQDFWVHPMILSLQSYQFYKLFEEVKNNKEEGIIEIEVPSLKTFAVILYWIYTGDSSKLLEIAKLDESLCKGIMENIQCLEIEIDAF